MRKIFCLLLCLFTLAGLLISCNSGTPDADPGHSDTEAQVPPEATPIEQVISSLDANAVIMQIGSKTQQVLLHQNEWAEIAEAFADAGYAKADFLPIAHAAYDTVVMYSKDVILTLQNTEQGAYAVWEPYCEDTLSLLVPNAATGTGEVTLAQLGIARTEETDNPMNGMCYVYKLSDGSAVIIDGGLNTKACRENVMNTLQKLEIAKNAEGKYRITAWILTHGHKDHRAAFTGIGNNFADQIELSYVLYNFPTSPGPLSTSTFDLANFEAKMAQNYPNAQHVVAHAGLTYHFDNLSIRVLYSPEMLYAPDVTIDYYNDTSLIFIAECAGTGTLFMGDAGEVAAELAWSAYAADAFEAEMLQIAHHGFNTGNESHRSKYIKQIYNSTDAAYGLLPMGSQYEGEERNGRHTVLVRHGGANYQITLFVNRRDKHGLGQVTQEYYDQFVADVAAGTNTHPTLFGYDGVNKIVNEKGVVTYAMGSETEPMITLFSLSADGVTVKDNRVLSEWLG